MHLLNLFISNKIFSALAMSGILSFHSNNRAKGNALSDSIAVGRVAYKASHGEVMDCVHREPSNHRCRELYGNLL